MMCIASCDAGLSQQPSVKTQRWRMQGGAHVCPKVTIRLLMGAQVPRVSLLLPCLLASSLWGPELYLEVSRQRRRLSLQMALHETSGYSSPCLKGRGQGESSQWQKAKFTPACKLLMERYMATCGLWPVAWLGDQILGRQAMGKSVVRSAGQKHMDGRFAHR